MEKYVERQRLPSLFFFNDTATTEIYTLSLHDALPIFALGPLHPGSISEQYHVCRNPGCCCMHPHRPQRHGPYQDRKSTRLNSSHSQISYAVFCLKKKKIEISTRRPL